MTKLGHFSSKIFNFFSLKNYDEIFYILTHTLTLINYYKKSTQTNAFIFNYDFFVY